MPAIKPTESAGTQLVRDLQDVLNTHSDKWNYFFDRLNLMTGIFEQLSFQIENINFFTTDYSIAIFFDFLKKFIQSVPIDINNDHSILLNQIDKFFLECKKTILDQKNFTQEQINLTVSYFQLIHSFFWSSNKRLLDTKQLTFTINDLSEIITHIVNNKESNTYIRNLISNYISIIKLSLNIKKFFLTYQQQDFISENVEKLGQEIFNQQDSQALFTIPHFFSALAYEVDFNARHWQQLNEASVNVEQRQEEVIKTAKKLQEFFLSQLNDKHHIPRDGLKYLFFKYFLQEAKEIKVPANNDENFFGNYSNNYFTPLPFSDECPTTTSDKFVIKHSGLTDKELAVICQAKACAEDNYGQWLTRLSVNATQLPSSDFTYHVFNESNYDADLNYYEKYEPISTAIYQSRERNATVATGRAYAQYRSNKHNQWQTTAHEYTHHRNFVAFGNIPPSFNEGLAYRLILGLCIDSSFQDWLKGNYNNYTSLELLSKSEFIGYNPSTLLMSYLVDTNPPIFAELLRSY